MAQRTKDFQELLAAFADHGVRAIVVGGYAYSFHARPRLTKDFDVLVEPTHDNAVRVLAALDDFMGELGLSVEDFDKPGQIVQLGVAPWRIDLITSIAAVPFDDAWRDRVESTFHGAPAAYLSREHLIVNKKTVGRLQDLADVEKLEALDAD